MAADVRSGMVCGPKKERALGRVYVLTQQRERVPLLQADNEEWFNELGHGMRIAFSTIRDGEPRARCVRVLDTRCSDAWRSA